MTDKLLLRKNILTAEFLSESYRVSGEVSVRDQPLVDLLNDKMSHFVKVENVYLSPIDDPSVFRTQSAIGQLRKDRISMVVLPREEDGYARHTLYRNIGHLAIGYNIFAAILGFEVRGGLKLSSQVDVDNMLMQSVDRFISVYRATATLTAHPEMQFTGGSILLNRELATLFTIERIKAES
jgi:hypothetical protein